MCNCDRDIDPNKLACEVLYKAIENHIDVLYREDSIKEADFIIEGLETANSYYYKLLFTLLNPNQPQTAKNKAVKK